MEKDIFKFCDTKFVIEYNEDTRNVDVDGNPEHDTDERFLDYVATINGLTEQEFRAINHEDNEDAFDWDEIVNDFKKSYENEQTKWREYAEDWNID